MEFQCKNHPDQKKTLLKVSFTMRDGKFVPKEAVCPICGEYMEDITDRSGCTFENVQLNLFSSKTPSQKKELLKKRSHDDNNKRSNREKKDYMDRNNLQKA